MQNGKVLANPMYVFLFIDQEKYFNFIWKVLYVILQAFGPILMKYRFKNMFLKESLTRFFYVDLVYNLRSAKGAANFISSRSKIVKPLGRFKYDQVIIEGTIGLVLARLQTCTDNS